MIALVSLQP